MNLNLKKFLRVWVFIFVPTMALQALINPGFTPVNLVEQSVLIETIEFGEIAKDQKVICVVKKIFKGESKTKEFTIDLSKSSSVSHAKAIAKLITESKKNPGIFLVGKFNDTESGEEAPKAKGFLHVSGKWVILYENGKNNWEPTTINPKMQGTWAGGTDMLIQAVQYIIRDDDPIVPVNVGVSWEEPVLISIVPGKITSARPVDIDGKGKLHLFIANDLGDKLYQYKEDKFIDVTSLRKLSSKSSVYAWLDLNGDGKLDLVSSDGKSYTFYKQNTDGSFSKGDAAFLKVMEGVCKGLFAVDADTGKAGLLVATDKGPILYKAGSFPLQGERLNAGGVSVKSFGKMGSCLVADLDGDTFADILQLFENGSLFYKAKKSGVFDVAKACEIALGKNISKATVGDFDGDGLVDVFTTAEDGNQIWHNRGQNNFEGSLHISGEIDYISKDEGVDTMVCDVNNDGKQDIYLAYDSYSPQIFFNRGFRSFGHAHMLDLTEKSILPESSNGIQTGCVADFNADGAQDMITVLKNGEIHYLQRESEEEDSLVVKVDLTVGKMIHGPVTVTGWLESGDEMRCLGAWSVSPGTSRAFIGLPEAGPCVIKWRLPGGKMQSKEIEVEDSPVTIFIK